MIGALARGKGDNASPTGQLDLPALVVFVAFIWPTLFGSQKPFLEKSVDSSGHKDLLCSPRLTEA